MSSTHAGTATLLFSATQTSAAAVSVKVTSGLPVQVFESLAVRIQRRNARQVLPLTVRSAGAASAVAPTAR